MKRFLDDIITGRLKDQPDTLFEKLQNNHPNIKYTTEVLDKKFIDIKI